MIGRHFPFWESLFSAAMLVSRVFLVSYPMMQWVTGDNKKLMAKLLQYVVRSCAKFLLPKLEPLSLDRAPIFSLRLKKLQKSVPVFEISFDLTVDIIEHIPFTLTVTLSSLAQSGALNARDLSKTQLGGIVFLFRP